MNPFAELRRLTAARVALGRVGASLPTAEVLGFALAHARARDAVHTALDVEALARGLAGIGLESIALSSAAPDRASYLRRPDLGRRLAEGEAARLPAGTAGASTGIDIALVIADGLSSTAVEAQAVPFLTALLPGLRAAGLATGPAVIVRQGRVAIGDEIGAAMGARLALVLIGERPGLSAADSLGLYLTFAPRAGRTDAERNCLSNIRAGGLPPPAAAETALWLLRESLRRGLSGVDLKEGEVALAPPESSQEAPAGRMAT